MKTEEILTLLREKIYELKKKEELNFKEIIKHETNFRGKKGVLEHPGCYVIYEKEKPIYVGSAGKGKHVLKYRMGDLFFYSPQARDSKFKHTLTNKLLTHKEHKRFSKIDEVRDFYLNSCSVKVIETDTVEQARLIESALILKLNPKYNA